MVVQLLGSGETTSSTLEKIHPALLVPGLSGLPSMQQTTSLARPLHLTLSSEQCHSVYHLMDNSSQRSASTFGTTMTHKSQFLSQILDLRLVATRSTSVATISSHSQKDVLQKVRPNQKIAFCLTSLTPPSAPSKPWAEGFVRPFSTQPELPALRHLPTTGGRLLSSSLSMPKITQMTQRSTITTSLHSSSMLSLLKGLCEVGPMSPLLGPTSTILATSPAALDNRKFQASCARAQKSSALRHQ